MYKRSVITSSLVFIQLLLSAGLLRHQHGNHQFLHQSHNPLLCLQEVQKVLQGKHPLCLEVDLCCEPIQTAKSDVMITQRSGQPGREKLISGNTHDDGREMGMSDKKKKILSESDIPRFTWIELLYY